MTKKELKALPQEERQAKLLEIYNSKKRECSMYTTAGNRRVQKLISKCMKKVLGKKALRQEEFEAYVIAEIKKVESQEKFSEIGDTAVREVYYHWIELAIEVAGYKWDYVEFR